MKSDEINGNIPQLLYGQVVVGNDIIDNGVVIIEGNPLYTLDQRRIYPWIGPQWSWAIQKKVPHKRRILFVWKGLPATRLYRYSCSRRQR